MRIFKKIFGNNASSGLVRGLSDPERCLLSGHVISSGSGVTRKISESIEPDISRQMQQETIFSKHKRKENHSYTFETVFNS